MKKRIFALALALCMMLSVMPTSFAGNGFLTDDSKAAPQSGVLTDDSKTVSQSGVLTGASKYYRQDGILYNTGSQSGAPYSLPSGTLNAPTGVLTLDENVNSTTTLSGSGISAGTRSSALVTDDKNGLELSKKVDKVDDNNYKITLEAYTTGKVVTTEKAIPLDVIFIIDQSGSMEYGMDGNENANDSDKRITIVKDMMIDFLNQTVTKTKDSSGDIVAHHRIAVVGFSSEYNNNNELLTGVTINNNNGAQFGSISQAEYAAALQDVSTPAGQQNVLNAINALTAKGGTQPTYGFEIAQNVFKYDNKYDNGVTGETNRQKVVIFLTDGEPDAIGWFGTGHEIAEKAVEAAYPLKDAYGATVYTIGIFEGADPTHIGVTGTKMLDETTTDRANRFMNLASSNYPTANSFYLSIFGALRWLADVPERAEGDFYLSAINKEQLANIFTTVSEKINSANIDLGSTTEVRDAVSPYFDLPEHASEIKLYTAAANADGSFEDKVSAPRKVKATISDHKTVSVTGFDFNENFVSGTAKTDGTYGKKLIIEIPIEPKTGFLGGNGVPTNDDANAGIYLANNLIENFPNTGASTNVDIADVTVDVTDKNIYLSQTVSAEDLVKDAEITIGDNDPLDMTKGKAEGYGLASWKYDFVDIEITSSGTSSDQTNDFDYTVTCTVKPKPSTGATAAGNTKSASGTVNVFKPVVTFQDSTIYLGATPTYSNNYVDVVWKHGDTEASESMGAAPELTYSYSWLETAAPTDCTDVNVGVAIGQNDVTSHVTFTDTRTDENEFTVHVIRPTITFNDIEIYLSQTPVYNPQFAWDTTCQGNHSDIPRITGTEPNVDYVYSPDANAFTNCTDVNVTVKLNNEDYTSTVTLKNGDGTVRGAEKAEFKVHVFLPQIALESQDLWADYDCDVDLNKGIKSITITGWADQCGTKENKQHTGALPQCSDPVYQFERNGEKITGYNAKNAQVTDHSTINVALDSVKIGATNYAASVLPAVTPVEYNIHVNKFDLTISKTWNGADVYKQDAIFTVSGGLGEFQVVLPAGQESITVKNLLCGQKYEVTEDSGWTWRWNSSSEKPVLEKTDTAHTSVSVRNPHDQTDDGINPGAHGAKSVYFTNSLINRLWFSFCTFLSNIFGRRGN